MSDIIDIPSQIYKIYLYEQGKHIGNTANVNWLNKIIRERRIDSVFSVYNRDRFGDKVSDKGIQFVAYNLNTANGEFVRGKYINYGYLKTLKQDWGEGKIAGQSQTDKVYLILNTIIQVPDFNHVRFRITCDDGFALEFNGKKILQAWKPQPPTLYTSDRISINPNDLYSLEIDYFENTGGGKLHIQWSFDDKTWFEIPYTRLLRPNYPITKASSERAVNDLFQMYLNREAGDATSRWAKSFGATENYVKSHYTQTGIRSVEYKKIFDKIIGTGIRYYIYGLNLNTNTGVGKPTKFIKSGVDQPETLYYNWSDTIFDEPKEKLFVRLVCNIEIPRWYSQVMFRIRSNEGSYIKFNGKRILDNSGVHGWEFRINSLNVNVKGGNKYPFEVEVFNSAGNGAISVQWSFNGGAMFADVPCSRMFIPEVVQPIVMIEQKNYEVYIPISTKQAVRIIHGLVNRDGTSNSSSFTSKLENPKNGLYRIYFNKSYQDYPMVIATEFSANSPGNQGFRTIYVEPQSFGVVAETYGGSTSPITMHFQFMAIRLVNHESDPSAINTDIAKTYSQILALKSSVGDVRDSLVSMLDDKFSEWEMRDGKTIRSALGSLMSRIETLEKETFKTGYPYQQYYNTPKSDLSLVPFSSSLEKEQFRPSFNPFAIKYYDRINSLCNPLHSDLKIINKILAKKEKFSLAITLSEEKETILAIIIIASIIGASTYFFYSKNTSKQK